MSHTHTHTHTRSALIQIQIINSFEELDDELKLIQTKLKVVEQLKQLKLLRGTDDFGDEVKILELRLCELNAEIQKRVQTHTNNDLC